MEHVGILLCHPGIDLKIRDKTGNTPFAAALQVRNNKAAQNILERLPNAAEQIDQRGRNFLHLAIMRDDLESVLFLLSLWQLPGIQCAADGGTLLCSSWNRMVRI